MRKRGKVDIDSFLAIASGYQFKNSACRVHLLDLDQAGRLRGKSSSNQPQNPVIQMNCVLPDGRISLRLVDEGAVRKSANASQTSQRIVSHLFIRAEVSPLIFQELALELLH